MKKTLSHIWVPYFSYIKKNNEILKKSFSFIDRKSLNQIQNILYTIHQEDDKNTKLSTLPVNLKDLEDSALQAWSKTLEKTNSKRQSRPYVNPNYLPIEFEQTSAFQDRKRTIIDILHLLTSHSSLSRFEKYWVFLAESPVVLIAAPELLSSIDDLEKALNIFKIIANRKFYPVKDNNGRLTPYNYRNARYHKSVMGALNVLVDRALNIGDENGITKNTDLIYEALESVEPEMGTINLFHKVAKQLSSKLPMSAYSDFFAILFTKGANLKSKSFDRFISRLLMNGTDSEVLLVQSVDQLRKSNPILRKSKDPVLPLSVYKFIMAQLGSAQTPSALTLGNWVLNQVVFRYGKTDLAEVLEIALRFSGDTGSGENLYTVYQFIIQHGLQPTIETYGNLFRGFRRLADVYGTGRCFEILESIHSQNLSFPVFICTEILKFIQKHYHSVDVYRFYLAYFEDKYLDKLGIKQYFSMLEVPDTSRPPYNPTINPVSVLKESSSYEETKHPTNPTALSILYESLLKNKLSYLRIRDFSIQFRYFIESIPVEDRFQYHAVFDSFFSALTCFPPSFEVNEIIRMILNDMTTLLPSSFSSEKPLIFTQYRYSRRSQAAYFFLIDYFCKTHQINLAQEVFKLASENKVPFTSKLVMPFVKYYIMNNEFEIALQWVEQARSQGAVITLPSELEEYINSSQEISQSVMNPNEELVGDLNQQDLDQSKNSSAESSYS